jgi:hypothetical protein
MVRGEHASPEDQLPKCLSKTDRVVIELRPGHKGGYSKLLDGPAQADIIHDGKQQEQLNHVEVTRCPEARA